MKKFISVLCLLAFLCTSIFRSVPILSYAATSATPMILAGQLCISVLRSNGTVESFGSNEYRQCDTVRTWSDVIKIAGQGRHIVGLKKDGTVVAAGCNEFGECDVNSWSGIIDIEANAYGTFGLKSDGSLLYTGSTGAGYSDVYVNSSWIDVVKISYTAFQGMVGLKSDGSVIFVPHDGKESNVDLSAYIDMEKIYTSTSYFDPDNIPHIWGINQSGQLVPGKTGQVINMALATNGNGSPLIFCVLNNGTVTIENKGSNIYGECDVNDWSDIVDISTLSGGAIVNYTAGLKRSGEIVYTGLFDQQYTPMYPVPGSTNLDNSDGETAWIGFGAKVTADEADINIKVIEYETEKVVHEYTSSAGLRLSNDRVTLYIENALADLEPNTKYSIIIKDGAFSYDNISSSQPILGYEDKDVWSFTTMKQTVDTSPIIIVPGVMGSCLYENTSGTSDTKVWPPDVDFGIVPDLVRLRKMNYKNELYVLNNYFNDIPVNQVKENAREYGAQGTYEHLVEALCEKYENTRAVYFFSYDFRDSNVESAIKLAEFIEALNVDKVSLVCHSMGGIVASQYIKLDSDNKSKISKLITLGTPYEGAPQLLNAVLTKQLLDESSAVGWISNLVLATFGMSTEMKSSFPGVAELAPTLKYVDYQPLYRQTGDHRTEISSNEYVEVYNKQIFNQVPYSDVLDAQSNIDSDMQILMTLNNSYFAVGTGLRTMSSILFKTYDYNQGVVATDLVFNNTGDGTVPYESATMINRLQGIKNSDDRVRYFYGYEHTELAGSNSQKADTINWVIQVLDEMVDVENDKGNGTSKPGTVSGKPFNVVHIDSKVTDVEITYVGQTLTNIVDAFSDKTDFGEMYLLGALNETKIFALDETSCDVLLKCNSSGIINYSLRFYDANNRFIEERSVKDLEVAASTIISTSTGRDGTSDLLIDDDGDGNIDRIVPLGKITCEESVRSPIKGIVETDVPQNEMQNNIVATLSSVIARTLNVRSGAGTDTAIIGKLVRNEVVKVLEIQNGWAKIEHAGGIAYVSANYIVPVAGSHQVTATRLNVRSAPAITANRIGYLSYGSVIQVYQIKDGWAEILYNGRRAYVSAAYLKALC